MEKNVRGCRKLFKTLYGKIHLYMEWKGRRLFVIYGRSR